MEDNEIIALFYARSEQAIAETEKKYGKLCHSIAENVLGDHHMAEECVNDAYMAAWNTIPPAKPDPFMPYICRLTRNISINRYKYEHRKKRDSSYDLCLEEIEKTVFDGGWIDGELTDSDVADALNGFIEKLTRVDRTIIIRRYWYMDGYAVISKMTGLKENAVRKRAERIRKMMKKYLVEKGVIL